MTLKWPDAVSIKAGAFGNVTQTSLVQHGFGRHRLLDRMGVTEVHDQFKEETFNFRP